jgi:glyoxylate/succinic semialdehyde reductase
MGVQSLLVNKHACFTAPLCYKKQKTTPSSFHHHPSAMSASLQTAEPGKTRVGFLGMGIMGKAMAHNLIKAGYDVTVWNRSSSACQPLLDQGATLGSSPAAVVDATDITLAMLSDPRACVEVALGPQGVVKGLASGKGYIDVSTVDAATAAQVEAAVHKGGGMYLEAPVSGSKKPAEDGQLIFLTAGDRALFDAGAPLLDVMGKASFYLGDSAGNGANMKLVVNMIMGCMMASFAEGLALAEKSGLKKEDLLEVIKLGAIAAPMFSMKGPTMIQQQYATAFPLKHQQKDLRLALELGGATDQRLDIARAANRLYEDAMGGNYGDADFSAVMEAVMSKGMVDVGEDSEAQRRQQLYEIRAEATMLVESIEDRAVEAVEAAQAEAAEAVKEVERLRLELEGLKGEK